MAPTPRGNQPARRSGRRRRHRGGREYGMSGRGQSVLSVDEAIRRRRSVRAFLPDEVPEAILRSALELAQLAPSNCNAQPWTPHVVSGEALVRLRAATLACERNSQPPIGRSTANIPAYIANVRSTRQCNSMARWALGAATSSRESSLTFVISRSSMRRTPYSSLCQSVLIRVRRPTLACMRRL